MPAGPDEPLIAAIARARRECPEVTSVDDEALAVHLRALETPLTEVHAGDLLLARACTRGDAVALRLLDRRYAAELRAAVLAAHPDPTFADEVLQNVWSHVLVGEDARLASYAGAGPLGAWLRVVALRAALTLRRGRGREVSLEDSMLGAAADDPRGAIMLGEHGARVREIVRAAIGQQERRMRTLLRSYYCDGAGVEDLGRIYRVHASTISRWLAQTRRAVLAETRRRLAEELALGTESVAGMIALIGELEISLGSVLRDEPAS